ncbi:HsdM family class I SAM-dependent methyltransferase [Caldisericum sp.]|uniref:HsdM family class I SAM-dependent methyltransferase n=1 Tax=Caldisericum sp. TaxID=2499687 RepID=UPI003D116E42
MNMKKAINLLKEKVQSFNRNEVKIINNELIYSLGSKSRKFDISLYNQNVLGELGRAFVILKMIVEFKIPPEKIILEQGSPVGSPSKRIDVKIDIANIYNERKCIALVECKTSIYKIRDSEFTDYFKRQLYNIAHSYAKDKNQPYPLILIAYEIGFSNKDEIEIFYRWFSYPEVEVMVETGQVSLDEVISRNSTFAYDIPPQVSNNNVYFTKKPLTRNDLIDIKNPNELKNLLKEKLHQKLRNFGIVEENAFKAIINLLLAKTYDEIQLLKRENKEPDFQVKPEDYSSKEVFYDRIKTLLENALIQLLGESSKEAKNKEVLYHKDKEKILLDIVPYLQRIKLRSIRFLGEDSVGDVFLDFMHSIFRQSRGLFFTHPNICRFVCKALNIQRVSEDLKRGNYKYILDPACGSGTFLIEALRLVFKDYPIEEIKENALKILFGVDNEANATALCKVNMVIHGDGSANIYTRDALLPLSSLPLPFIKEQYIWRGEGCTLESLKEGYGVDFIITNPPFSLEIRRDQYNHFKMKEFLEFKKGISTASECLFAERWYQLLNPKGRLGAVLPCSLFDSDEYLKARLLFLCYFKIIAIVGLPEHAFAPHAQQKTVLVFAERRTLEESNQLFNKLHSVDEFINELKSEKIIFYDAKNIGYVRTKKRKTVNTINIEENDLTDEIADIISLGFEGNYIKDDRVLIKTLGEIYNEDQKLILTPKFLSEDQTILSEKLTLEQDWEVADIEKPDNIDMSNLLICETGDIVAGGAGIITPKNLSYTTASNKERIKRKIISGKFGVLREGDVIIAPVRIYQKKIAVVTKSATRFLFSKDFIVLRRKEPNLKESFSLFLSLIQDINIKQLERLSSIGKSGYPKIKDKKAILQMKFTKIEIPAQEIEKLIKIYDDIYENIFIRICYKISPFRHNNGSST